MTWLITGGAGYIGSHVARAMSEAGEAVVVYDDLSTGFPERLPREIPLVKGSTLDRSVLDTTIARHGITGVVHLAAKKQVPESVARPLLYYRENVHGLQVLLEAVANAGIRRFVFSSSAAVYGMPDVETVTEETPCVPINPYGETKLAGEWLVRATGEAHGIATACLRYFNVAGAGAPELADIGVHNLVPMVFKRLDAGEPPVIFGDDYPTPDGTCVRDYIHVADIASAHLAAARRLADLADGGESGDLTVNIGRGEGVSVRAMVDRIRTLTGHENAEPKVAGRRPGDPARVVASADRIRAELGWSARYGVDDMIASAWAGWRQRYDA